MLDHLLPGVTESRRLSKGRWATLFYPVVAQFRLMTEQKYIQQSLLHKASQEENTLELVAKC